MDHHPSEAAPSLTQTRAEIVTRSLPETPRIFMSPPDMSNVEREALLKAFDSGWVAPVGPDLDAFEVEFAEYLGVKHAVAVSSGTAALHLALRTLGVGPGDVVLASTLTFVATANAIRYVGAEPVFIDSEFESWNLDPELLREELQWQASQGRKVAAVIAVDLFGQCADYDRIVRICDEFDVPLVADAAESLGARYHGTTAGSFGELACFSFNGNKMMTTSGGGMVVTDNPSYASTVRQLATQAREPTLHYEHESLGFNYRLSNLLAAVGRGQLRRLDSFIARRREIFEEYRRRLDGIPGLSFMPEPEGSFSTRWLTCLLIDPFEFRCSRDDVIAALEDERIESRPVWKPMHLQPLYEGSRSRGGQVAESLFTRGLCLPSGSSLASADVHRISEIIRRCGRW